MPEPEPIFVSARRAAKLLGMTLADFRAAVSEGLLPQSVLFRGPILALRWVWQDVKRAARDMAALQARD